jgi:hypothetical protein
LETFLDIHEAPSLQTIDNLFDEYLNILMLDMKNNQYTPIPFRLILIVMVGEIFALKR